MICFLRRAAPSALLFLLALMLRTCGISHGIQDELIVHPDAPKQVRAVQHFLEGRYLLVRGHLDYDGYPLFHSHMVEYVFRAEQAARGAFLRHAGEDPALTIPDVASIFWVMRLMNAVLSALLVPLAFLVLRREYPPWIALTGSLLLALSPLDITFSHYATGDIPAGFFATLALLCAARFRPGAPLAWYALAGLTAAAGFSSKYHAGLALAAAGLAHAFSGGGWRIWFGRAFLLRAALLLLAFVGGVFLTSPALLVNTGQAWDDMRSFFAYTANYSLSPEEVALPLHARMELAFTNNLPVILRWGGPALLLALTGLLAWRRSPAARSALLMGGLYLLAIAGKPELHVSHHTVVAPAFVLAAACGFGALWQRGGIQRWAGALAAAATLFYAGSLSRSELFQHQWSDTRWIAETWAIDNLPPGTRIARRRYTIDKLPWESDPTASVFRVVSHPNATPRNGESLAARFDVAADGLSIFRNRPVQFFGPAAAVDKILRRDSIWPPQPASRVDRLVLADTPWHARSPRCVDIARNDRWRKVVGFQHKRPSAWLWIRTELDPVVVEHKLGNHRHDTAQLPYTSRVIPLPPPSTYQPWNSSYHFATWSVRVRQGTARIMLLTDEREARQAEAESTESPHNSESSIKTPFACGLELLDVRGLPSRVRPGEKVALRLNWSLPDRPPELERLHVWVHLVDDQDRLMASADHRLADSLRSGRDDAEDTAPISLAVPADLKPGTYHLIAGLWEQSTRRRFKIVDAAAPWTPKHVEVGRLQVEAP